MNGGVERHSYRRLTLIWGVLLSLLALTTASAYLTLGVWNGIINLTIAALKAALVLASYMELRHETGMTRTLAAVAIVLLAVLFALSFADYATRFL